MISIEGYESINVFARVAKKAFQSSVERELRKRVHEARANDEPRPQFPFSDLNCETAGRMAVYDLLSRKFYDENRKPKILRPDGTTLDIAVGALLPSEVRPTAEIDEIVYGSHNGDELRIPRNQFPFLEALKDDYWVEALLTKECFSYEMPTTIHMFHRRALIIDWRAGVLDLRKVKAFQKAVQTMHESLDLFAAAGLDDGKFRSISFFRTLYMAQSDHYRALIPFDGCMIIAPTDWLKELSIEPNKDALELRRDDCEDPVEVILKLYSDGMTRGEIKTPVSEKFNLSARQFGKYWADAASKNSDLAKPGRKKQKS